MIRVETGVHPLLLVLRKNWWMLALRGILSVLLGALFLWRPTMSLNLVVALFGVYAAFRTPPRVPGRWLLATGGMCSLFLAGLILVLPHAMTPSIVSIIGAYAVVFGLSLWAAASSFRKTFAQEAISAT